MKILAAIALSTCSLLFAPAFSGAADSAPAATRPADPYLAKAQELERAIKENDSEAMTSILDEKAFLDICVAGVAAPPAEEASFRHGAGEPLLELTEILGKQSATGANFKLLHMHVVNGQHRGMFRLLQPNGGLNYHDWVFTRQPGGGVHVTDVYLVITGQLFSGIMHDQYVRAVVQDNRGAIAKILGKSDPLFENSALVEKMNAQIKAKDFTGALATYHAMPEAVQKEKIIMIQRVAAALSNEEKQPGEYTSAIMDWEKFFPKDPALDLMALDQRILAKKFDEVFATLDRIDTAVGGDPYLNVMRANVRIMEDKPDADDQAKKFLNKAIAQEPTLKPAYFNLVALSLKQHDDAETIRLFGLLKSNCGIQMSPANMEKSKVYADFVQSDAYAQWKKTLSSDTEQP